MTVEIRQQQDDQRPYWQVCHGSIRVRFEREADATTYAVQLEQRLNAPRAWPLAPDHSGATARRRDEQEEGAALS